MMKDDPRWQLQALRAELTARDEELVRLLARRTQLIDRVAALKSGSQLPAFDREREGAHMDTLLSQAAGLGVAPEVVRDVFGTLFTASRATQRRHMNAGGHRFSIGIIGGTAGMGGFLARVFGSAGYALETTGLEAGSPAGDVASRHDLVIIAVPISVTLSVIEAVAPRVRPGACLMDVTSLKRDPLAKMLACAPAEVDVVGTHPMFGPQGTDMDRQKVVLCPGRGEGGFTRVRHLFQSFGAEIIESTADEHDAQMAIIQVLVHEKTMVLGSVLERLKASLGRSLQFASPIYRAELSMIGRMFSQSADLYADILTSNADGARVSELFEQEAARFAQAVIQNDRDAIERRFREIAEFMTEFAGWAKRESDAILHDIVRHG